MKQKILIGILVLSNLGVGYGWWQSRHHEHEVFDKIEQQAAEMQNFRDRMMKYGVVVPRTPIDVVPEERK
jgi:hypothetical protein